MDMAKKLTLDDFRIKAAQRFQGRKTSVEIETEMGLITFNRPTENTLLTYINRSANAVVSESVKVAEGEEPKSKVISQDLVEIFEASKVLVFATCPFLKDVELQASVEAIDPIDVVSAVFGINKTMEIAGEIGSAFTDSETMAKVEEEIKN